MSPTGTYPLSRRIILPDAFVAFHKEELDAGILHGCLPVDCTADPSGDIVLTNQTDLLSMMEVHQRSLGQDVFSRTKRLLVVRILSTNGEEPSETAAAIEGAIFGTGSDPNLISPVSLVAQYSSVSHGQLNFIPAQGIGITNGVVQIRVSAPVSNFTVKEDLVNYILQSTADVLGPLDESADQFIFCLPSGSVLDGEMWTAFTYILEPYNFLQKSRCTKLSVVAHEVGHSLGFQHSGKGSDEYGDETGYMGYSYNLFGKPQIAFNAHKHWLSGWMKDRSLELYPLEQGQFLMRLVSFVDFSSPSLRAGDVVLLKIGELYLQYNKAKGYNLGTIFDSQVTIAQANNPFEVSHLMGSLSVNQAFVQRDFNGTGFVLRIGVCSAIEGIVDYAIIDIRFDNGLQKPLCSDSLGPSNLPSLAPSAGPSTTPSLLPSKAPVESPSSNPSVAPTTSLTSKPTLDPTIYPSKDVSSHPTSNPTTKGSSTPSENPTMHPSYTGSLTPTSKRSFSPTQFIPTASPKISISLPSAKLMTMKPNVILSSLAPTKSPSFHPPLYQSASPMKPPIATLNTLSTSVIPFSVPSVYAASSPTTQSARPVSLTPSIRPVVSISASPPMYTKSTSSNLPTRPVVKGTTAPSLYITPTSTFAVSPMPSIRPVFNLTPSPSTNPTQSLSPEPSYPPIVTLTTAPSEYVAPSTDPTASQWGNPSSHQSDTQGTSPIAIQPSAKTSTQIPMKGISAISSVPIRSPFPSYERVHDTIPVETVGPPSRKHLPASHRPSNYPNVPTSRPTMLRDPVPRRPESELSPQTTSFVPHEAASTFVPRVQAREKSYPGRRMRSVDGLMMALSGLILIVIGIAAIYWCASSQQRPSPPTRRVAVTMIPKGAKGLSEMDRSFSVIDERQGDMEATIVPSLEAFEANHPELLLVLDEIQEKCWLSKP